MAKRTKPDGCCAAVDVQPLPEPEVEHLARVAKALSDPSRIQILRLLGQQQGRVCACDVVDFLGLSQPTVSHHLSVLKRAGLVNATKRGLWVFYSIDADGAELLSRLHGMFGSRAAVAV